MGETVGKNRVLRLMRGDGLASQRGYAGRPRHHTGKPATLTPNHLQREFTVPKPNQVWVMDITYIRTHEGCSSRFILVKSSKRC